MISKILTSLNNTSAHLEEDFSSWKKISSFLKKMELLCPIFLILALITATKAGTCERQLVPELSYTLSGKNLNWPHLSTKENYETSGRYIPKNIIITRTQIYKDEAIVAMPRYKSGVPFTLGVVSLRKKRCGSRIEPFPYWQMQEEGNCNSIQSAVDIVLDVQNILWVLDLGIINTLEQPIRKCSPKVVAIDVKTGKVLKIVDLSNFVSIVSRLQYLVVDYASDGVYLYISDAATGAIIVFEVESNRGFRVVLPQVVTSGSERRDVLYLLLVRKSSGTSFIYFTYLGSNKLFCIKSSDLRNEFVEGSVNEIGKKINKIVMLGTDNGSAIFFRNKGESDVYMWNTETSFRPENFLLVQKGNECRLPTQVLPGYKRLMWVIESNFHDYIQNKVGCTGPSISLHPLVKSCEDC